MLGEPVGHVHRSGVTLMGRVEALGVGDKSPSINIIKVVSFNKNLQDHQI
jgi:hypothetical protein